MKRILLAALLAAPIAAHAWNFEVGAGVTKYQAMPNGFWYQEGLPHDLRLKAPALQIGVTGNVMPHLDWHIDYVYLGMARSDVIATTDENYSLTTKSCIGTCTNQDRLIGYGDVNGIKISLEPYYVWRGIRFAVEAGLFIYKPRYHVTGTTNPIEAGYAPVATGDVSHIAWTQYSPMIGASIGRGNVELSYQYFKVPAKGDRWDAVYRGAHVLQIRYKF